VRSTTELREEILTAARAEFAAFGLAGSRIDRIAKNAHASKERLYAHFGDKEALFREVVATDRNNYFAAITIRPEGVADFVGDVFDLTQSHPEHVRMITWARLEGLPLAEPDLDGEAAPLRLLAAIEAAQAADFIDSTWGPSDLLVLLFGIALAWAQFPDPHSTFDDPATIAARRAAAVKAAARILAPRR
jgi:TetR/AcrR family transcriptional regulator